jgi:hypothetical protein
MVKNLEVKKYKVEDLSCPNCGREWSEVDEDRLYEIGTVDEDSFDPNQEIRGIPMICGHCDEAWNLPINGYVPVYFTAIFKHTTGSDDVIKIMKIVEAEDMKIAEHLANKDAVANSKKWDEFEDNDFAIHVELESIKEIGYNFSIYDFPEEFIIRQEDA